MINSKVSNLWFTFLVLAASAIQVNAEVYKCVVNGKTVYSDSRCAYQSETLKINPNQNAMPSARSSNDFGSKSERQPAKCKELLEELRYNTANPGQDSYEELVRKKSVRNAIQYEYEATCMTSSARDVQVQNRNIEMNNSNNEETQRQLREIQRTQKQIQNKQLYGY